MAELTPYSLSDPVAKGCTRPAMMFGVPLPPLVIVAGAVVWLSTVTSMLLMVTLLPIVFVMGLVTRTDDQAYRLLGLKMMCRTGNRNRGFWNSSAYCPVNYGRRS